MLKALQSYNQLLPLLSSEGMPHISLSMIIAGCIGFSIRIAYNWERNGLTAKDIIIRLIFAFGLSYMFLFASHDFDTKRNVVFFICGICAMSMEIVNALVKVMQYMITFYQNKILNSKNE